CRTCPSHRRHRAQVWMTQRSGWVRLVDADLLGELVAPDDDDGWGTFGSVTRQGGPQPSVFVSAFISYGCPGCAATALAIEETVTREGRRHGGRIAFDARDFPLDIGCNPRADSQDADGCFIALAVRHMSRLNRRKDFLTRSHLINT